MEDWDHGFTVDLLTNAVVRALPIANPAKVCGVWPKKPRKKKRTKKRKKKHARST